LDKTTDTNTAIHVVAFQKETFHISGNPFAGHRQTCAQGKGFKSQTGILNKSLWSKAQAKKKTKPFLK